MLFHSFSAQVYTSPSLHAWLAGLGLLCWVKRRRDRSCSLAGLLCDVVPHWMAWKPVGSLSFMFLWNEMWRCCTLCLTHWIKPRSQTRVLTFDLWPYHCHNALKPVQGCFLTADRSELMLKLKVHWRSLIMTRIKEIFAYRQTVSLSFFTVIFRYIYTAKKKTLHECINLYFCLVFQKEKTFSTSVNREAFTGDAEWRH